MLIVGFTGTDEAVKASVGLSKLLEISFTTSPAISVKAFDKLMGEQDPIVKQGKKGSTGETWQAQRFMQAMGR